MHTKNISNNNKKLSIIKKRFNIYCTLIFIAIAFSIVYDVYDSSNVFDLTSELSNDIAVVPKNVKYTGQVYNTVTGKNVEYAPLMIRVSDENTPVSYLYSTILVFSVVFTGIALLFAFFGFISLIRKVRKGEIFASYIVKSLRLIGVALIVMCIFYWIGSVAEYKMCCEKYNFNDYRILFHIDGMTFEFITGIGLLIISEVIKMGKEMKEDQELTI